jgi:acetyl-CoA acetyltransferase
MGVCIVGWVHTPFGRLDSMNLALEQAGCKVGDLSLAEVHDCFTIAELLSYVSILERLQ